MMKKNKTGFAGLILILIVVAALSASAAGYLVYKDTQQRKKVGDDTAIAENLEADDNIETKTETPKTKSPLPKTEDISIEPEKTVSADVAVSTSTNVSTKLGCDDYGCLISAATQCQPAAGTITYSGLPNPLGPGISNSGKTKYEIKKIENGCTLVITVLEVSLEISDQGMADIVAEGKSTEAEIRDQLKELNEGAKDIGAIVSTCASNSSTLSSYLRDLKNGYMDEFEFSYSADTSGESSATQTTTTTDGQKITCIQ